MLLRPEIQLQSMIKALKDVVLPAVDPDNKLAQEQAGLIMGMMTLMAEQAPVQFEFDCNEIERLISLAAELKAASAGGRGIEQALAALDQAVSEGQARLDGARSGPRQLLAAINNLRAATGEVVTQVFAEGNDDARAAVQAATLRRCGEQLLRDRALLRSQGWEPDPAVVPPLAELLARDG